MKLRLEITHSKMQFYPKWVNTPSLCHWILTFGFHFSVPEFIPMDATAVYLDGNDFEANALINDEFIGRKHLTSLYLNNSKINFISNQTFKGKKIFVKGPPVYKPRGTL